MTETREADAAAVAAAAELIRSGKLVAFGTETVYGLGGDATNSGAVARIFDVKGRPAFNPLISHLPGAAAAFALGKATKLAELLAARFWPGPMTLVLDRVVGCPVSDLATGGLDSIALRVPAAVAARELLREADVPVAAPSANRSGRVSPTLARHVEEELGKSGQLALILDTGPAGTGLESTVIDARREVPVILRPGGVTREMVLDATGADPVTPGPDGGPREPARPRSPGRLESHYAPDTPLLTDRPDAGGDGVWVGFGPGRPPASRMAFNLSPGGDLAEAAARLYAVLRDADAVGAPLIAVAPIPREGLGVAINDRLTRAAASSRQ